MSEPGIHRDGAMSPTAIERPMGRRRADRIVGASRSTQQVVDQAMAAAGLELPVLIVGPPGAGKNHIARAVHAWSKRNSGPLVVLSAGAFSEALLGRELSIRFDRAFPHRIRGWRETEGSQVLSEGTLTAVQTIDYWNKSSEGYAPLREELQLPPMR